jgi:replication initiator protein RepSA
MARSCGYFTTRSRRYSTIRKALKSARRHWRRARQAVQTAAEHTDEKTTLVVGALIFAGIGYRSTGDQWLALTAAAQARKQR